MKYYVQSQNTSGVWLRNAVEYLNAVEALEARDKINSFNESQRRVVREDGKIIEYELPPCR